MSWIPTRNLVLLDLEPVEEVRASGLVLSANAESSKMRYAVVRVVGPEVRELSAGDLVLISGYAGTAIGGEDSERLVKEVDVMAVVK